MAIPLIKPREAQAPQDTEFIEFRIIGHGTGKKGVSKHVPRSSLEYITIMGLFDDHFREFLGDDGFEVVLGQFEDTWGFLAGSQFALQLEGDEMAYWENRDVWLSSIPHIDKQGPVLVFGVPVTAEIGDIDGIYDGGCIEGYSCRTVDWAHREAFDDHIHNATLNNKDIGLGTGLWEFGGLLNYPGVIIKDGTSATWYVADVDGSGEAVDS